MCLVYFERYGRQITPDLHPTESFQLTQTALKYDILSRVGSMQSLT